MTRSRTLRTAEVKLHARCAQRNKFHTHKLQALVYDTLPPATAIIADGENCQLTGSLSLVLQWQKVCNRKLELYQGIPL